MGVLALFGLPFLIGAIAAWRGYVLSVLWSWFLVPHFGLTPLSIPFAIGLSLVAGMLTESGVRPKEEKSFGDMTFRAISGPAITLLIGWIVTKFM